ncbi:unnamed protein product [Rotaria sp. Silwood2]|nr:unnamed protein product [Rotaria sp. Silwood2]CAF4167998.1 unnamed protein product [Rotaria sp. Silwood2]
MYDSGVDTIDDCTIIYAGMSSDNKTKEACGVTIFLDRQATGAWKNLGSIWEANEELIKAFQDELAKRTTNTTTTSSNIDQKYNEFVHRTKNLSETIFGQNNNNTTQKKWITDEILHTIDKKAEAFLQWQNYRPTRHGRKYYEQYRRLRNLVKKKIKVRQMEYWDELSEEIENAIKQHDSSTTFATIRRFQGGRTNIEHLPIQDKKATS